MSQLKAVGIDKDQIPVAGSSVKANIDRATILMQQHALWWPYDGSCVMEDTCRELQSLLAGIFLPFLRGR